MSPRAAWRLDAFGFVEVYDFVGGKADWLAAGLPTEGTSSTASRAFSDTIQEVPTCHPDDRVGEVARRVRAAGWDTCVVVNRYDVVAGRLRRSALDADPSTLVEEVMQPGPTTIRPDTPLDEILDRLRARNVGDVLVTTPEGKLIGLLQRHAVT